MPSFHFRAEAHFPHGKHTPSRPIYLQTTKKESTLIILFFISLSSCPPSNPPKSNYHLISVHTLFSFSCFYPFLFPHYSYHLFSSLPPAFEGRGRCWHYICSWSVSHCMKAVSPPSFLCTITCLFCFPSLVLLSGCKSTAHLLHKQ